MRMLAVDRDAPLLDPRWPEWAWPLHEFLAQERTIAEIETWAQENGLRGLIDHLAWLHYHGYAHCRVEPDPEQDDFKAYWKRDQAKAYPWAPSPITRKTFR